MSQGILLQILQEEARSRQRILQSWRETHPTPLAAPDVQDLVQLCLRIPKQLRLLWARSFRQLVDGQIVVVDEFRGILQGIFESELAFMKSVQEQAAASELVGAIERVARLQGWIFQHWPEYTAADAEEARAEMDRGEALPIDDAFAEMSGMDKETWLRHIEEHQRKHQK